ncbi:hypothetical protein [Aureibacter tunicatorum]|uniref:SpoIIAA-like protein n=1 Tax=Aureibacter tunicatorum TaxID=866807 RepID=A0AAE3XKQ3_9BACT|nr:hypothetical protein [Aureibacter tunicatorum]MDR6238667.1 hypothetical protein [Aureibacter tunicatorum]BDD05402.1 hypothetical protein AUTU_28850 [Aureibacter tunicatorum]
MLFFTNKNVDINYLEEDNLISVNWKGYQTLETIQNGMEELIKCFQEFSTGCLLIDNRQIKGTWTMANDWIVTDWTPRAKKFGYHSAAFIFSDDVFSRFSIKRYIEEYNDGIYMQSFSEEENAIKWLNEKQSVEA